MKTFNSEFKSDSLNEFILSFDVIIYLLLNCVNIVCKYPSVQASCLPFFVLNKNNFEGALMKTGEFGFSRNHHKKCYNSYQFYNSSPEAIHFNGFL